MIYLFFLFLIGIIIGNKENYIYFTCGLNTETARF